MERSLSKQQKQFLLKEINENLYDANGNPIIWDQLLPIQKEILFLHLEELLLHLDRLKYDVVLGHTLVPFQEEEMQHLMKLYHETWCNVYVNQGWSYGKDDLQAKTTVHLVDYKDLSSNRLKEIESIVRMIPVVLHKMGFMIEKRGFGE